MRKFEGLIPGTTTPNPIIAPLITQLRKFGVRVTLLIVYIQFIKRNIPTEMTASNTQCVTFLPCLPDVLNKDGKVPAIKPIKSQMN